MIKKKEVKKMPLVKVRRNSQITIPNNIIKNFNIVEGDYMEVEKKDDGIVLKPVKIVHPDQAYFYTKEWQKGEAEADKDIAEGRMLGPFDNVEDFEKAMER